MTDMTDDEVKEWEDKVQGVWKLKELTAEEFLREVANLFEVKVPSDKETWLEIKFTDRWGEAQIMHLWMPSRGPKDGESIH